MNTTSKGFCTPAISNFALQKQYNLTNMATK